jgi:hypothetical protein
MISENIFLIAAVLFLLPVVKFIFSPLRSQSRAKNDAPTLPYFLPFGFDTLWEGIKVPPSRILIKVQQSQRKS